jgi:hypothetical protein
VSEISERELRAAAVQTARERRGSSADVEDYADMAARVDAAGPVQYLIDPLWPEDAYGVIAARDKAGKTWAVLDLAVSTVTGGQWMNRFPCRQGRVVVYCGEGGERNIVRRVRAVAEHKGVNEGLLGGQLFVSERAPRFKDSDALDRLREELVLRQPALVVVDPLYLAAAGGRGSDLYAMGELLVAAQEACQDNGAALALTHHWRKGREGAGAQRMTGVGPGAWGRVLGSGDAVDIQRDGDRETVTVEWEFTGSEIPGTQFTMVRTVWSDDLHDLSSPLHYEVETQMGLMRTIAQGQREQAELDRLHEWLQQNPETTQNAVKQACGKAAEHRLRALERDGRATWKPGPRRSKLWSAV